MVAVDLGAESCRVSLLRWVHGAPQISVVHRSANGPIQAECGLMWDFEHMFDKIAEGLAKSAESAPEGVASIGVDGWAVDYVRIGEDGVTEPFCYRDERTVTAMADLHKRISTRRLYELTGTQVQRFNTLYQLHADSLRGVSGSLPWINLPEYLLHRLGGRRVSEYTNATPSQMLGVQSREWCPEIFDAARIPLSSAPPVVPPGTDIGALSGPLKKFAPYQSTRLIAPACHDTASAVAGIPAHGDDWAFISSGTWSLVGAVVDRAYVSEQAMAKNFTNQGGVGGANYLLKNVNGMWMLRQCMNHWHEQNAEWDVAELVEASASLPAPDHLLDVDDPELLLPGNMPARINAQFARLGCPALPEEPSQAPGYANLIFHSLAARYAEVLDDLSAITGKRFSQLFVVGGGTRNLRLKQLVEEATSMEVIQGSAESSTIGNFAIQMAAMEGGNGSSGVSRSQVARWAEVLSQATPAASQRPHQPASGRPES
jgi:rhamnulokinase